MLSLKQFFAAWSQKYRNLTFLGEMYLEKFGLLISVVRNTIKYLT